MSCSPVPAADLHFRFRIIAMCSRICQKQKEFSQPCAALARDELGGAEDMAAVQQGLGCGVRFVASIHGETREDLQLRCGALLGKGGFEYAVLLKGNQSPGQIAEIMTLT